MKLSLTKAEWAIIEHRLTLSDCLADCLADTFEWDWQDIYRCTSDLYTKCAHLVAQHGHLELEVSELAPVEVEALRDCVEGSTWFGSAEDAVHSKEITRGQLLSWYKSANSIEAKFEAAGIKTTGFPRS